MKYLLYTNTILSETKNKKDINNKNAYFHQNRRGENVMLLRDRVSDWIYGRDKRKIIYADRARVVRRLPVEPNDQSV